MELKNVMKILFVAQASRRVSHRLQIWSPLEVGREILKSGAM